MIDLQEKIKEAKETKKLQEENREKVSNLKEEIWKELQLRFPLVIDRGKKEELSWYSFLFNEQMQVLLRSMIKRDKIIHLLGDQKKHPNKHFDFNLTQKHGLKYPRHWKGHSFIPRIGYTPSIKDGKYEGRYCYIDFSVLKGDKNIDGIKLEKFFDFLTEILKLYFSYSRTEQGYNKLFEDCAYGIKNINSNSSLETFAVFLEKESVLKEGYEKYAKHLRNCKQRQNKLVKELKTFNKPFRFLLALKK